MLCLQLCLATEGLKSCGQLMRRNLGNWERIRQDNVKFTLILKLYVWFELSQVRSGHYSRFGCICWLVKCTTKTRVWRFLKHFCFIIPFFVVWAIEMVSKDISDFVGAISDLLNPLSRPHPPKWQFLKHFCSIIPFFLLGPLKWFPKTYLAS